MHIFEWKLFGLQIQPTWYGLMYALGFIICYYFMKQNWKYRGKDLDDLLYFVFFGVILGGRLGYVILYKPGYFLENPSQILTFWNGGMSFHGGFLGTIFAIWLFSRIKKYNFFSITDTLAIIIPIALGLGRIGNFINQELLGFFPYNGPFRVVHNNVGYFPSPLLEMFLEGIILFITMIFFWKKTEIHKTPGKLSALFLIGYGIARLISEQFRLPDAHVGYLFNTEYFTLGMIYTLPMIFMGSIILWWTRKG